MDAQSRSNLTGIGSPFPSWVYVACGAFYCVDGIMGIANQKDIPFAVCQIVSSVLVMLAHLRFIQAGRRLRISLILLLAVASKLWVHISVLESSSSLLRCFAFFI
jgi:hypothetical protein